MSHIERVYADFLFDCSLKISLLLSRDGAARAVTTINSRQDDL